MINNILISREKRVILHRDKIKIGLEGENLQEVLVFNLDEDVIGEGIIEIKFPDGTTGFIEIERTERGYELPVKSSLLKQNGQIEMQLRILQEEQEVFKSEIMEFRVKESINATETIPEQYPSWIDNLTTLKANLEKAESERVDNEDERISNEDDRIANEKERQTNYTNIKQKVDNGEFNGATFMPSVDKDGNISWTNDKGLENPIAQNIKGPQGIQGPQGEAFKIKKTYSSIEAMQNDFDNMEVGDYVMIATSIELEDNAKLYARTETEWIFITDFSGATGIQGPQGIQGIQGSQGERGIGISKLEVKQGYLYVTLTDNTTQNAGLIITDEVKQWLVTEITNNAESTFNQYYDTKVSDFNKTAEEQTKAINDNAQNKITEYDEHAVEFITRLENVETKNTAQDEEIEQLKEKDTVQDEAIQNNTKSIEEIFGNFIHISFDDVQNCTKNLINGEYTSIYNEPFFKWIKNLHDTYGAKFSLYVYNIEHLLSIPDTYKDEFFEARSWLKFGLHSTTDSGTYVASTYAQGQTDWNLLVEQVIRFAGSQESIDRIPRLNYFKGTKEALQGMRDCFCGALGFLCADDTRTSYYLSEEQNDFLNAHDHIIDFENGLIFYKTDFRGDWFKMGFTSVYDYDAPTETNVYEELVKRLSAAKYGDTFKSYIWFCHEWQIYDGVALNTEKSWVEDICRFSKDYGIPCDFPQNRITINPTCYMFLKTSSIIERLEKPSGLKINGTVLTWNAVDNAISYGVYDGDILLETVSTTNYDLSQLNANENHIIYVQAISGEENYMNSYKTSIEYGLEVVTFGGIKDTAIKHVWSYGDKIERVYDIQDLNFEAGYVLGGGKADDKVNAFPTTGRCTSLKTILYGNFDGKTVTFAKTTLNTGTSILYSLWYGYVVDGVFKGSQYLKDDVDVLAQAWLNSDKILPIDESNTNPRVLLISFKRGDGTTNFTSGELEELKSCITISD